MDWTEVVVKTTTEGIEPVAGLLIMHGVSGYTVQDSEDFEKFLRDKEVYWDYIEDSLMELRHCDTTLTFYITDDAEGAEQLYLIRDALRAMKEEDSEGLYGELSLTLSSVAEEDWANNWKKYFKPLEVGNRLLVKPTWEEMPGDCTRTVIEIDPSSSFGTGSHTTTKLCLGYIETMLDRFGGNVPSMIDVGCGSGILGIAAYKLGAGHITAIDIEENSIRVARENFAVNRVPEEAYDFYVGSITDDKTLFDKVSSRRYPVLAANIVADVLKAMAPYFRKLLGENGLGVLSGIIAERADEVIGVYRQNGFIIEETTTEDGWTAALIRNPAAD